MKKIGWKETVTFAEFDLEGVPAKVDTGARTSVLHCSSIELIKRYRKSYVKFIPLDASFKMFREKEYILPFHKERRVKNSFGQEENRFVIQTTVKLFNRTFPIELSLRDRSNMEFPVLLGRSFVRKLFLVDVARSNLSEKYILKKIKNSVKP